MSQNIDNRHIRIFISSTFNDMQDERNELVSKVFPLLRKKAAERDVTLTDIDLRWGITKEESESSKVIDICMDEIDKSHPFFIGLLGTRYGWKPSDDKSIDWQSKIAERHGWVLDDIKHEMSITEMEIQYGALRNDAPINGMFFLKECDENSIAPEQARLRREVREQHRFPVYNYDSIQSLSDQIIEAFSELLDKLFPIEEADSLEAAKRQQRYWLEQKTRHFIRREQSDKELRAFMESNTQNLLVTGESGMGKSTWLAAATLNAMTEDSNHEVIAFFAGNSSHDATFNDAADWLCRNIADRYDTTYDASRNPIYELGNLAKQLRGQHPLLVIIDGINQLSGENAKDHSLTWWPAWPDNVKVIFSMPADSDMVRELNYDTWRTIHIGRLDIDQRVSLAEDYLADYRKVLSREQKDILGSDYPLLNNSLIYSALLDEIRRYGNFDMLNDFMTELAACQSANEFFSKIIDRQVSLFNDKPNIVKDTLSLICLSENGLTETQLLKMTGTTRLALSQLLSTNEIHLTCKDGKITTAHDMFRHAVTDKYLADEEYVNSMRQRIINYFKVEDDPQSLSELPYQYYKAGNLDDLYHTVCQSRELSYFTHMHRANIYASYWNALIKDNPVRYDVVGYVINALALESEIRGATDKVSNMIAVGERSSKLLFEFNDFIAISNLFLTYVKSPSTCRRLNEAMLKALENEEADTFANFRNKIKTAMAAAESMSQNWLPALTHSRQLLEEGHIDMSSNIINNIGEMYLSMYEKEFKPEYLDHAINILRDVLEAQKSKSNGTPNRELANAYANYGCALYYKDPETALQYSLQSIEIYKATAGTNNVDVAQEYYNLGTKYKRTDPSKALEYAIQALQIYDHIGGENSLSTIEARNLVAIICLDMAAYEQAYNVISVAADNLLKYDEKPVIWPAVMDLMFRASYFSGRYEEAVKTGQTMIELYGDNYFQTIKVLEDIGKAYTKLNDQDMAVKYYERAAVIADTLGEFEREMESYVYFAKAMHEMHNTEMVLQIFDNIARVASSHGLEETRAMAFMLFNRAMMNITNGNISSEAVDDIRQAIEIYETHYPNDKSVEECRRGLEYAVSALQGKNNGQTASEDAEDIPEIEEMASYLNGELPEVLEQFTQGMRQFKAGNIDPAEHSFSEALRLLYDADISVDYSVTAQILRYIAFSKEIQYRQSPGSQDMKVILRTYAKAMEYANNTDNPSLTGKIAHDAAACCLYFELFDIAENYYLEEMFQTVLPRDIYNTDFVITTVNLTTTLMRKGVQNDTLFKSIYELGYAICQKCNAEDTEVFMRCAQNLSELGIDMDKEANDIGSHLRTIANYIQTTDYAEKHVLSACLAHNAMLYYRELGDKEQEAATIYEYAMYMLNAGGYGHADSLLSKGEKLSTEYCSADVTAKFHNLRCLYYVMLHDIRAARELCNKHNIDTDIIAQYEQEICQCYSAWRCGDTATAEYIAGEVAKLQDNELNERICYDMVLYNHARGKTYEAKRYAALWPDLAMTDDRQSELFRPAYEYIRELLN